eukprot:TRINITY_DN404_c0_g3_i4.p1 TRINITY_DN404_c0_g3~~TRINITY_DN404_c0_g3_i4.p1  ORF type:complete len:477 (-),score=149.89 TRINITY_DN404_c0_g3_i4:210-1436(-)
MDVLFNIKTSTKPHTEEAVRPPLSVALVLDRSGSMSGEKFIFAKQAVQKVIDNLEAEDLVHLVVYDNTVDVIFENLSPSMKEVIASKLAAVQPRGSTNLSGGLQEGARLLETHKKTGYNSRIFLFSDGLANAGITDKPELYRVVQQIYREKEIKIDSFGIGSDFDEPLMRNIAEYGAGEFFFIANAQTIPDLVSKALKGLLHMVGSETTLKIRGKNGCCLKAIHGHHDLVAGASLGDLHEGNLRRVLCQVEISPKGDEPTQQILTFELSYRAPDAEAGKKEIVSGSLVVNFTEDETKVANETKHKEVVAYSGVQRAAEMDTEIEKLVKAGSKTEALKVQKQQIELLKSIVDLDESGMAKSLLVLAVEGEKKLSTQGASAEMAKHYAHQGYMKRRGSMSYCQGYEDLVQ